MNAAGQPLYDLAVIGGGVNGCGIARDAAGRGARVLLLEAGDLAGGTSSASTKLIHGGLRYLEHYEFGLVRESLSERERLWAIAPHIAWPMRFVLPYVPGLRPRWLVRLGLFLYDHIGGRKRLPATETVALARHPAGTPLKPEFTSAFVYSDCWVDDARLVVLNARDAADRGAEVRTRCRVTHLRRDGDAWQIEAGGERFAARAVINAAGPGVIDLLDQSGLPHQRAMRLVRGSHIVVPRLFDHPFAYFFQLPDGRIFFAIPYEGDFTLIGTTDVDHHGGPIAASEAEIAYLCEGASRFFRQAVTPADVVWTYSGVRPLIDDGSGRPEAATRGYDLDLSDDSAGAPLLSVFGGKITTYRHLAEEAVETLAERLPVLRGHGWTAGSALPGGDFAVDAAARIEADFAARFPFLAPAAHRLVRTFGTTAFAIFEGAASLADCGRDFGHGLTEREVRHLVAREWARSAEDVLWRRTKLGLRLSPAEAETLDQFIQQECRS
ncbi:homodimeric glycerol 3-phosphate dehydrogenase (quinone) [Novosphingobium kunmingense]|uniref:Glycerol-3-phosphate dehydrogenase n=1 Tax=Novosphingobium kunmingense TaxID=1211806 RepID=A0A2N0I3Z1_9SPHN|nr:glycerol-3-phosphate dehydrogenase [Novosphingobium kunmingense]PKB25900.1 homodimeric glycerol 3-phosphate dehydrogenase (quinone) [Novosphingobium kunmingense]